MGSHISQKRLRQLGRLRAKAIEVHDLLQKLEKHARTLDQALERETRDISQDIAKGVPVEPGPLSAGSLREHWLFQAEHLCRGIIRPKDRSTLSPNDTRRRSEPPCR